MEEGGRPPSMQETHGLGSTGDEEETAESYRTSGSDGGVGLTIVSLCSIVLLLVIARIIGRHINRGRARSSIDGAEPDGGGGMCTSGTKEVYIVTEDGSEQLATLQLHGVKSVAEVKAAIADIAAEMLEDDEIVADHLVIELRDGLGRRKPLLSSMPISAVMRAHALRARSTKLPI